MRKRSGPKAAQQAPGHGRGLGVLAALDPRGHRAVARAAGQADEPLGVALDVRQRHARLGVERVLGGPAALR